MHWLRFRTRACGLLAAGLMLLASASCAAPQPQFASRAVAPPAPLPDLSLVAQQGTPFRLSEFKGHVVVVYVGYTHCPDICPLTLGQLAAARQQLPDELRDEVKVVMITADPARDTPELMAQYVRYFDPTFIGVSGSTEQVLGALRLWDIEPECSTPNADGAYTVSHPATSFVLNREGLLRLRMSHDMDPAAIARDLTLVAHEGTH